MKQWFSDRCHGVSHLLVVLCCLITSISRKELKMPFFKTASSLRSDSSDVDLDGLGNFLGVERECCYWDIDIVRIYMVGGGTKHWRPRTE